MGGIHKNWHRRFFVLQPGVFYYYKSEPVSYKSVCILFVHLSIHPSIYSSTFSINIVIIL